MFNIIIIKATAVICVDKAVATALVINYCSLNHLYVAPLTCVVGTRQLQRVIPGPCIQFGMHQQYTPCSSCKYVISFFD